jgi:hypothetical protein
MGPADTAGHQIIERIMQRAVKRATEGRPLRRVTIADMDFDDAMRAIGGQQFIGYRSVRMSTAGGCISVFASDQVELGQLREDEPPPVPRGGRFL